MRIGDGAEAIGKGLVAGAVGTAAMTVSQTLESKLRHREPSTTPADAGSKVLGVEPLDEEHTMRFANIMHWVYGTTWGAARGLLGWFGLPPRAATAGHFAAVQGTAVTMLPAIDVTPPATEWPKPAIASEVVHHAVYAAATGAAYSFLTRHSTRSALIDPRR